MRYWTSYKRHTEFLISTKATLLQDRVNEALERLESVTNDEGEQLYFDIDITPFMSYAGEKGYMIGCMIKYKEYICEEPVFMDLT